MIDKPFHQHIGWVQNVPYLRPWSTTAPWDWFGDNHLGYKCQKQTPGVLLGSLEGEMGRREGVSQHTQRVAQTHMIYSTKDKTDLDRLTPPEYGVGPGRGAVINARIY